VRSVVIKTANYQILASDGSGTMFTTRGAVGAVTFTLPVPIPAAPASRTSSSTPSTRR
jgi:hypothetical protein